MKKAINWVNESIFYQIYPLGLTGAPRYNEGKKTEGSRILQIIDWIPHLKHMDVNAIYFGPIFQSIAHGYDTSNYYETDSRLGTKEDFKLVFKKLHENDIRVILDGVFNHVGRGFWAFNDLQHNLEHSKYKDWFSNVNFSYHSPAGDKFSYDMWEGNADLIKLNLRNQDVVNHLLGAVGMWIEEWGIDGLRLDAADCVDIDFFKKLRQFTKEKKSDFWLMGEIIHGDYRKWANEEVLDSVTNYESWKGIYSSHNDKNYFEIAYALKRQFGEGGIYKDLCLYSFLDNHDVNRIASLLKDKQNLNNVYTMMFAIPGVPSIYYGSEWGILGEKTRGADADLPIRQQIQLADEENTDKGLIEHIKMLAQVRKSSKALQYGSYEEVMVTNEQFAFARKYGSEVKIAVFNCADEKRHFGFQYAGKSYQLELRPHSSKII